MSSLNETSESVDNGDAAVRAARSLQQLSHAKSSVREYRNSLVRYLQWLLQNSEKQHLITTTFRRAILRDDKNVPTRESILAVLDSAPKFPPLYFSKLTADDFLSWVEPLRREKDGSRFAYTTYSRHRSAFYYFCEIYNWKVPPLFENKIAKYFWGLKRTLVNERGDEIEKPQPGKRPITFRLYKILSNAMISIPTRDMVFARTFMLLSWNLIARVSDIATVCYSHLEWSEDALRFYFAQPKTDQFGICRCYPRHVYANPLQPELCPILALGMFWLCNDNFVDESHLFSGNDQSERFREILSRTLKLHEVELENKGQVSLGTHSFRKGSAYFANGTIAVPSSIPVHIEADSSLSDAENSDLSHVDTGDTCVGRVLSGLPYLDAEFATPPPHFVPCQNVVDAAKSVCFPGLPTCASTISAFALASVVYHADYLKRRLPKNHPVLTSTLFTTPDMLRKLQSFLASDKNPVVTLTGIPPHVVLQQSLRSLTDTVESFMTGVTALVLEMKTEVAALKLKIETLQCARLGSREGTIAVSPVTDTTALTVNSQLATTADLANLIAEFRELKTLLVARNIVTVEDRTNANADVDNLFAVETQEIEDLPRPYPVQPVRQQNGRFPGIVSLPEGGPLDVWVRWVCGVANKGFPPYRRLQPDNLSQKDRNRLPDLRFLMDRIENRARQLNLNTRDVSAAEAANIYRLCRDSIAVPELTERGRKRRCDQLSWHSIVSILRKEKRQRLDP